MVSFYGSICVCVCVGCRVWLCTLGLAQGLFTGFVLEPTLCSLAPAYWQCVWPVTFGQLV